MIKIMYFDDISTYKLLSIDNDATTLQRTAYEMFNIKEPGNSNTDPWMNRMKLMSNEEYSYIIVPSNIPCYADIEKALQKPFFVYKTSDYEVCSITKKDEDYIISHISDVLSVDNIVNRIHEYMDDLIYSEYLQKYREMFYQCSDTTLQHLRTLFTYSHDAAKKVLESLRTKESFKLIAKRDPKMSQFYLEFHEAIMLGRCLFGKEANELCDLDKVFEDEKHMEALRKAISSEAINIYRCHKKATRTNVFRQEDIKDEFIEDYRFGYMVYKNNTTGKYLVYKKNAPDPLNNPGVYDLTRIERYPGSFNTKEEAIESIRAVLKFTLNLFEKMNDVKVNADI